MLKNKSRPEAAAHGAAAWVISERELREKLRKEREARKAEEEREVRFVCHIRSLSNADFSGHQEKEAEAAELKAAAEAAVAAAKTADPGAAVPIPAPVPVSPHVVAVADENAAPATTPESIEASTTWVQVTDAEPTQASEEPIATSESTDAEN